MIVTIAKYSTTTRSDTNAHALKHKCLSCIHYTSTDDKMGCNASAPAASKARRGEVVVACASWTGQNGRQVLNE